MGLVRHAQPLGPHLTAGRALHRVLKRAQPLAQKLTPERGSAPSALVGDHLITTSDLTATRAACPGDALNEMDSGIVEIVM